MAATCGSVDIGSPGEEFLRLDNELQAESVELGVDRSIGRESVNYSLKDLRALRESTDHKTWLENIERFMRFGDLGPKSVHPGTNLIGEEQEVVSDYLVWRKYRATMVILARPFVDEMATATVQMAGPLRRGTNDSKPGVYSLYLLGGLLGIQVYNMVLDKVYSDYGGIPMKLAPGSRLETGAEPIADASLAVRTMADLAEAFFLRGPQDRAPQKAISR